MTQLTNVIWHIPFVLGISNYSNNFIINCRHEKVDNKMYCVGCIMFGIANNENYVTRPDSNSYLGQQSKLENIKVCYWGEGGGKNRFPYYR